jgi:hypothetical protein
MGPKAATVARNSKQHFHVPKRHRTEYVQVTRRQRLPPGTPAAAPAAGTSRETLLTEKADYEKQLGEANQQAGVWQQKALMASGALQAVTALLAKLDVIAHVEAAVDKAKETL